MPYRTPGKWKWIFIAFFLCIGYYSKAQLIADFSAAPAAGCAPLFVKFTDLSKGGPTEWKWDLGNGTISVLQTPAVTYFTPGQYNIKLVIKNSSGADSIIKSQYITVYSAPAVSFAGSPQTGCFPLPVQFIDMSDPVSGTISKWEWDFGDGSISGLQNPRHVYTVAGNFNVSLRITNSVGCTKTITSPQYIKINTGVKADFTKNIPNSCRPPVTINFSNTSVGTGNLIYQWDLGDGTTSSEVNPSHTYTTNGSFTVKLIVTNSTGCSDTLIKPNAITLGSVNADFSVAPTVCQGKQINLLNTSAPVPANVKWTFGDGTFSDSLQPVKIYNNTGNYVIKMVANFGACIDSLSKPVTVAGKSVINFNALKTTSCKAPFTVNFTSSVGNAASFIWDFGDSTFSTAANPSHTYTGKRAYTVKLIATNANGCSDTLVKTDFINIQTALVTIPGLPVRNCAPLTFDFKPQITSLDPVVSYLWNFGDNTTSNISNPSHTFIDTGSYTISLITTTASGCTDTAIFVNGVIAGAKPTANFNGDPREVCAFIPINFLDSSTGNVNQWLWFFGDGTQSPLQNPSHQYQDTGVFDVTLIAWSNGCADTVKYIKYVHILPPIASFVMAYNCDEPMKRIFTDRSKGADKYEWDFGDGNTSDVPSPTHIYANTGLYLVKLTVTNFTTGCSYSKTLQVPIIREKADFASAVKEICKGSTVNFQTQNINISNISSYIWIFGDGSKATTTSNKISHKYARPGNFDVTLIITDKLGCRDTLQKPLAITVNGPTAAFKNTIPGTCLNTLVSFTDSSYTDGIHPIQQWIWKYGDGKSDVYTTPPFQHSYTAPGIYTLSLKVIDSKGCSDSITRVNYLIVSKPVALFSSADTFKCPGKPIKFINRSTGTGLTYLWDFGDETTSALLNPSHTYANVGNYAISLSVKDQYGCTDKIIKPNFIRIVVPKADFLMSDSASNCPPLVVVFTNKSTNIVGRSWNFGDGTTSELDNPTHFYTNPGIYDVVLTGIGPGGCTDLKTRRIIIKGPQGSFSYINIKGCDPLQTDFKATTKNTSSFIWDFNDGASIDTKDSIISHKYTNPGIYLPKMILVDADGCQVPIRGIDTIRVFGVTADFTSNSILLCDSGAVRFANNSISNDAMASYLWTFGDGSNSSEKDPIHNYSKAGRYLIKLLVTTKNGCRDSVFASSPVKIIKSPHISIVGENGGCVPATFNPAGKILVSDTSDLSWKWDLGNDDSSTFQVPPPQNYTDSGSYTVRAIATNSSGCSDTATKTFEAYPLPELVTTSDTFFCQGKTVRLSVTGATNYSWSPSSGLSCTSCPNPIAKPSNSTQYVVKGSSGHGCISWDTVLVSIQRPISVTAARPQTLCEGATVELSASGADIYLWTPPTGLDDPTSARPLATPTETTNYRVIGSDDKGCFTDTAYVKLTVYPVPEVEAGEDKTINVGQTIDLMPKISNDVTDVNWSPTSGVFRNNYPGIAVRPVESTEYTVEVSNSGGCRARDKVTVYVICNNANVFVPNTFSPNNDGANDLFYPRGSGVFKIKLFKIFSRWGEVIYEKANINPNDATGGWDGTFKGQKLPPDVFVYILEVVCENKSTLVFKGNVALIR